jgi:hypothetical protein
MAMDELINQVSQRTGLAPDKARAAVDTVIGYVRGKLPGPVASQLDSVIGGGGGANIGDAAKGFGGASNR